jgi:hypothetical protein
MGSSDRELGTAVKQKYGPVMRQKYSHVSLQDGEMHY